jgi:hypothetical protein
MKKNPARPPLTTLPEAPGPLDRWNRFWFGPSDPIVLGLIRIVAGSILFLVLLFTIPWLHDFYGQDGWVDLSTTNHFRHEMPWVLPANRFEDQFEALRPPEPARPDQDTRQDIKEYRQRWSLDPRQASSEGLFQFSLWYHVTDPLAINLLHGVFILVALAFTLGLATRVTSVLAWVGFLSYIHRVPASGFGMDTMVAILLLYLMIGPSGAALSLDRWLARRWARLRGEPFPDDPPPSGSATFALRLLQIHFCLIYLASGTSKLQGSAWWNGTALWQTMSNYEFAGPHGPAFHELLILLALQRWLWELAVGGGCLFTLVLEISLPYLIWIRSWRWVMMLGSTLLHTGIAVTMGGLGTFSLAMLAMLLSFMPPETVRWLLHRVRRLGSGGRRGQAEEPAPVGGTTVTTPSSQILISRN